jgi:ElaB/YqjD/DUF883 family membrane-anchored ribosome-binding protein
MIDHYKSHSNRLAEFFEDDMHMSELKKQADVCREWAEQQIKERPVTVLLTAAALGLVAGWMIKWRQ